MFCKLIRTRVPIPEVSVPSPVAPATRSADAKFSPIDTTGTDGAFTACAVVLSMIEKEAVVERVVVFVAVCVIEVPTGANVAVGGADTRMGALVGMAAPCLTAADMPGMDVLRRRGAELIASPPSVEKTNPVIGFEAVAPELAAFTRIGTLPATPATAPI